MTIKAKRIKTIIMSHSGTIVAGGNVDIPAADTHSWQEDVTVIGVLMRSTLLDEGTGWDSGRFTVWASISRVAVHDDPGALNTFCNHLICREATVGINANQTMVGNPERSEMVMFPEGYGIDMDEDSRLYLNISQVNEMSNAKRTSVGAIVYYVER